MAIEKISKELELDLSKVPRADRTTVKQEIGNFIIEEIMRSVSEGTSPVSGRGKFKILNKQYAKSQKGGDRNPNLDLFGDMLDSLTFKNTSQGIEVGIFRSSQVPKADGHNNFSGESTLPERRFIPDESEGFKRDIEKGIKDIINDFSVKEFPRPPIDVVPSKSKTTPKETSVTIDDLFDDDFLESFLIERGLI